MPSRILQKYPTQKLFGLRVFLISIITATALFLPFIIMGGGVFYYYGDFNVQEIPFYQLVHDAVRNGYALKLQLLSTWQSVLLADNSVPK